jgi:hypothetical protein
MNSWAAVPSSVSARSGNCNGHSQRAGSSCRPRGTTPLVALQVVVGVGQDTDVCVANGFKGGSIVARRALGFVPHQSLTLPVQLEVDCIDVPCGATETCRKGSVWLRSCPIPMSVLIRLAAPARAALVEGEQLALPVL